MLSFPVNSLLSSNISILIGPMETSAVIATHPLCSRASVPQIAPLTSLEIISEGDSGLNYLLRMSPTEKLKAKAIAEIIKRYKWETMAVLGYQNKEGEVSNKFYVQIQFCTNLSVIKCGLQRSNTLRIEPWDNLPCAANRVFLQSECVNLLSSWKQLRARININVKDRNIKKVCWDQNFTQTSHIVFDLGEISSNLLKPCFLGTARRESAY